MGTQRDLRRSGYKVQVIHKVLADGHYEDGSPKNPKLAVGKVFQFSKSKSAYRVEENGSLRRVTIEEPVVVKITESGKASQRLVVIKKTTGTGPSL